MQRGLTYRKMTRGRGMLELLADFIETLPQHKFNMKSCLSDGGGNCGCMLYWAPYVPGIVPGHISAPDLKLWDRRLKFYAALFEIPIDEAEYLFASNWAKVDNTPETSAARIRDYIENGISRQAMLAVLDFKLSGKGQLDIERAMMEDAIRIVGTRPREFWKLDPDAIKEAPPVPPQEDEDDEDIPQAA